jgi:hypothetical protein
MRHSATEEKVMAKKFKTASGFLNAVYAEQRTCSPLDSYDRAKDQLWERNAVRMLFEALQIEPPPRDGQDLFHAIDEAKRRPENAKFAKILNGARRWLNRGKVVGGATPQSMSP